MLAALSLRLGTAIALTAAPALAHDTNAASVPHELEKASIGFLSSFDDENDACGWTPVSNVTPSWPLPGKITLTSQGSDPYLVGPRTPFEAASFPQVALRCRSNVEGITQVFFETSQSPGFHESQMVPITMHGDGQFHVYELDMRGVTSWTGTIQRLRVDPLNGVSETAAIMDLDWIAAYESPARLVPSLPWWKDASTLSMGFVNRGGRASVTQIEFRVDGLRQATLPALACFASEEATIDASRLPPRFWLEAFLGDDLIWRGRMVKPSPEPSALPAGGSQAKLSVASGRGTLALNAERQVELAPMASLTVCGPGDAVSYYEFDPRPLSSSASEEVYEDRVRDPLVSELVCTTRIRGTEIRTSLEAGSPLRVLRFEGPRMLETRPHTHAIFPGLEYLEAGEESSASQWTGVANAARTTPAHFKISAPMIVVEYDRTPASDEQRAWVAELTWDAQADPAREPVAEFNSRKTGLSYATLFLPARAMDEELDERLARIPLELPANKVLDLTSRFGIRSGTIERVFASHWLARIPKPPPLGWLTPGEHDRTSARTGPGTRDALEHIVQTCMLAYTGVMFDPAVPGWKSHISIGEPFTARRELGAFVFAESIRSDLPALAEAVRVPPTEQLEDRVGPIALLVDETHRKKAAEVLGMMKADGGIGYAITPEMMQTITTMTSIHGSAGDVLGKKGATNAGLIANNALPLLEYAAITRDSIFVTAAERALERMNTFTVPRGSQTWEIHADTPDLYASAQCARADLWGYRITGNERYLDEAERWLETGLPFLYWWDPVGLHEVSGVHVGDQLGEGPLLMSRDPKIFFGDPKRESVPFASLPVFGTSWYSVTWFGIPVQWCGLAWANAVRELNELRAVPALITVADGVFRSAANQQCDKGFLAGTIPDSWDYVTALSRQPYIIPNRLLEYAYRCLNVPHLELVQYARLEHERWTHLATRALMSDIGGSNGTVHVNARFVRGQNASLLVGGRRGEPSTVSVNGRVLTNGDKLWQQHWIDTGGENGVLYVRWVATGGEDHIEVGPTPAISRATGGTGVGADR